MPKKNYKADLNQLTREFILEKTGLEVSDIEAEEIRRSLIDYCRLLVEINNSLADSDGVS